MCGKLTDYPSGFHLDHVVPLYKGGLDVDSNLQVLDPACHDKKTLKDMGHQERTQFAADGRVIW
jgi:5-methylcytosine-specific restriction endonuclease McrA